jgi:hypothetical protein
MSRTTFNVTFLLTLLAFSACASSVPPSRLGQYLGGQISGESKQEELLPEAPFRAGLVLIADTTASDSAPALTEEAFSQMAEALRDQLEKSLRMNIEQTLPAVGIRPNQDLSQFVTLGQRYGLHYLVVAIASSTEKEYPWTVFLGWTTHSQPGLRRDNWSLIEAVLLDVKTGRALLRAEGRGWATLDRPTAAGINQWYPVIWKRPQEPNWRWWPPSYDSAPHTLRVIAMHEAVKRLILNMQDAWIEKRQQELARAG